MRRLEEKDIEEAAEALKDGKTVIFPTETVYGVGVVYDDEKAYKRLVDLKKRPPSKPIALMCSSVDEAERFLDADERAVKTMRRFLPGELTFLLKAKGGLPYWVTLGTGVIGIRVPASDYVRSLIKKVGKPCLVTSANASGEKTSRTYEEALGYFEGNPLADAIVRGECSSLLPSTIIDLSHEGDIKLIRQGSVSFDDVRAYWEGLE
jgi:L-threonylcarbamoyladenylate synthase